MPNLFPFGEPVHRLEQQDKTPKRVFVLGVYASAVHAKWINQSGIVCQALAVASEPYIFWDGNTAEAARIISRIQIPQGLGSLVLPNKNLNGPSSKVLAENILKPLGCTRNEAWLCDLLPESRLNPRQQKVIAERYNPLIKQYSLNEVTVPIEDGKFCDAVRREEITQEILTSHAETLVLLGDVPIKQYLRHVSDIDFSSLRELTEKHGYGEPVRVQIGGRSIDVVALAHPRQIGGLGSSSQFWFDEHKKWERRI